MNILYYIPHLDQEGGGVRQYAVGLLKTMGQLKEHKIFVLHNNNDPEIMKVIASSGTLNHIPKKMGRERRWERKVYQATRGLNFIFEKGFNKEIPVLSFLDRICRKLNIDVVHSPYQTQPFPSSTKNIFTLHDVQELHFPEYFTPEKRESRARNRLFNIKKTNKIVVSYKHIKEDIIKYFGFAEEKIHVILLNMQNLWFNDFAENETKVTKQIHGFDKFLLYPANTWQHKNHLRLLDAIALLRDEHLLNVNLVCVGNQNKHFKRIENRRQSLGLTSQVKFLGVVSEIDLYSLYQQCTGVVIPTIYEAGSFPLMESMMMEIPVICSNVTSLPETIGEEKFIFNPFDTIDIANKIKELWRDSNFRRMNIQNSKIMQNKITSTNALEQLRHLYSDL